MIIREKDAVRIVDWGNGAAPGMGYTALFVAAGLAFIASALALRGVAGRSTWPPLTSRQQAG